MTGRWLELQESGARLLQLRSGDRPLAELTALDLDGTVDIVLRSETDVEKEQERAEEEAPEPSR